MSAGKILAMEGISKRFTGVLALDGVSFDCLAGEVHAICGENGAGKSTLMKILGGIYPPDAGEIRLSGMSIRFSHPAAARRAGISIIHQELSLMPDRSVAENITLGLEPRHFGGILDRRTMRRQAATLLARVGARVDPDALVREISVAQRQLVEIAKAFTREAKILVLDEPTAALEQEDADRLLQLTRHLRTHGVGVVYISHRMPEVFAIADRITVLKDGRKVGTRAAAETSPTQIVRMMVGRELAEFFPPRSMTAKGAPLLVVEGGGNERLKGIALTLHAGEIVGIAGLEGSGKSDLARALAGDAPFTAGRVTVKERATNPNRPRMAIRSGIAYLTDDRKGEGLLPGQPVLENGALALRALAPGWLPPYRHHLAKEAIARRLGALDVRAPSFTTEIRLLSGGNQQKAIMARLLGIGPDILVANEPTRGIDVGAKSSIYRIMRRFADEGRAILMISSDLPEIVGVSDRILVMRNGRIVADLPAGTGEEAVAAHAVGTHQAEARA